MAPSPWPGVVGVGDGTGLPGVSAVWLGGTVTSICKFLSQSGVSRNFHWAVHGIRFACCWDGVSVRETNTRFFADWFTHQYIHADCRYQIKKKKKKKHHQQQPKTPKGKAKHGKTKPSKAKQKETKQNKSKATKQTKTKQGRWEEKGDPVHANPFLTPACSHTGDLGEGGKGGEGGRGSGWSLSTGEQCQARLTPPSL